MRARAAALLLLGAPALFAQPGSDQRAYLELFVNDVSRDTVLVYLRGAETPDDALVAVDDLEKGGLRGLRGTRELHDGREYVSLRSLAPEIEFRFDPQAGGPDCRAAGAAGGHCDRSPSRGPPAGNGAAPGHERVPQLFGDR